MIPDPPTLVMPTKRAPREVKTAPKVTLRLGCTSCGARGHDKAACAMRIEDERTGAVS